MEHVFFDAFRDGFHQCRWLKRFGKVRRGTISQKIRGIFVLGITG
jgi:hypothetical protein